MRSKSSTSSASKRSFSRASWAKARTTRAPATFSCSAEVITPNCCCTRRNIGRISTPKRTDHQIRKGITERATSASCQSSRRRITVTATRVQTAITSARRLIISMPRMLLTSSVTRDISWPVCERS